MLVSLSKTEARSDLLENLKKGLILVDKEAGPAVQGFLLPRGLCGIFDTMIGTFGHRGYVRGYDPFRVGKGSCAYSGVARSTARSTAYPPAGMGPTAGTPLETETVRGQAVAIRDLSTP
jgi:hypothetical protein